MRTMNSILLGSVFTGSLILGYACVSHVTPETPKAAAAITSDSIVIRVNELQAAVIQLCGVARTCAPNTISTATADAIVQVSIDLRTVLKDVPNGWQATVRTTWTQAQPKLAGITNPAILAAIQTLDAVIRTL